MSIGVLILIIVVVVVLLLGAVVGFLRRLKAQGESRARERFPDARMIVGGANFFGQESSGMKQVRGNGTLVVTDTELFFERWLPRREYRIPLKAVQGIETPKSYLGKTNLLPLLKVNFVDDAGKADSMAWLVKDLEGVRQAVAQAASLETS